MSGDSNGANEAGCHICELVAGGSAVWSDEHWVVCPASGGVGCFLVMSRRHAVGVWNLSDDEAAGYGPLLKRLGTAIRELCPADRVYIVTYGEGFPHFHAAVMPRPPEWKADPRITELTVGHMKKLAEPAKAREVSLQVGARL